jgi:hypothetical protein
VGAQIHRSGAGSMLGRVLADGLKTLYLNHRERRRPVVEVFNRLSSEDA